MSAKIRAAAAMKKKNCVNIPGSFKCYCDNGSKEDDCRIKVSSSDKRVIAMGEYIRIVL
jgi:hypothetical protein